MRVRTAEEVEAAEKQALQERYDVHLRQSDEETEWLYNDGYARRERHYQRLLKKIDKQDDSQSILKLAEAFSALKDYRDSQKLASYYKKCAEDALKKEKQKMERREKRIENIGSIIGIVFGGIIIMAFLVNMLVKPAFYYLKAERLLEEGHAAEAACYYLRADTFSNSESRYKKIIRNGKKDENLYATNKHIVELTIDGTVEIYHIWETNCDCGRERINNVKYIEYDEDDDYIYVVRSSGKKVKID